MYQNVEKMLDGGESEHQFSYQPSYKQYQHYSKNSNILQNVPIISKIKQQDKLFYLILVIAVLVIFMFSFVLINNSREIKDLKQDNFMLNKKFNQTLKILEDQKKMNVEALNSIQILKQTIKNVEDNMYKNTKQIVQIQKKFQETVLEKINKKSLVSNVNKIKQNPIQIQTPPIKTPIFPIKPAPKNIIQDSISQQFDKQSDQLEQNEQNEQSEWSDQQIKDALAFSLAPDPQKLSQTQYVSYEYSFEIPKIIWMYESKSPNYLNQLYLENIRYMSSKSSFIFRVVNEDSIQAYIPQIEAKRLQQQIAQLKKILNGQSLDYTIEKLILLNILNQNGGIMISGSISLAQDLTWIKNIVNNEFVNRGNRGSKPQMIGFYTPENKDLKKKFNIKPFKNMEQPDKYVLQIPGIEDFFFASIKKPKFLAALIPKLYDLILSSPEVIKQKKLKYGLKNPQIQSKYNEILTISSQVVLIEKQKKLDELNQGEYKNFAFDYFGLYLINSYYGPYKLMPTYQEIDHWVTKDPSAIHRFYYFYTHYSYEELTEYIGPIRYLFKFNCQNRMNQYLERTKNTIDVKIFKGSLVQKLFYPQSQFFNFIVDNPEKPLINLNNQLWDSLPKIIWVFWSQGMKNAPLFEQICFENLKRMAKLSGFQVRELNNTNKRFYIENQVMDRIQKTLKQVKMNFTVQTVSDLYRTYLIYKYGGIYLDITTFPLQKFDWILNIGKLSSEYVLNRFGDTPTVLLMRHPFDSQPEQWDYKEIDDGYNTKINWNQGFQSSFIAGQKDNQLVKQWFDLMLEYAVQPYQNFKNLMIQTRVYNNRWTQQYEHYLFVMDAVKCVMGRRQLMLEKENSQSWVNAADYYKVWTINSYLAQTKLRSNLNFQVPSTLAVLVGLNQYLFRYPQEYVDKIVGKTKFLVKFFGYESKQINQFIKKTFTGDYTNEIHSRSIFSLYFWNPKYKIESKNNILTFNPGQ